MWKVVLHKELKSQWVVSSVYDDYIEIHGRAFGLGAPLKLLYVDNNRTFVGAIELSIQDTFLVG
jgi:hypothetical protein